MTHTRVSEVFTKIVARAVKNSRLIALALVAAFTSVAMQPAQAQSSDTWKSIAIIGGSTAAGAYIGHKMAGRTGAVVGAGVGASVGYSIDRRRRANQYYDQYGDNGYYGNDPYYGNDGYYGGPYNGPSNGPYDPYGYPSGFQGNSYSGNSRFAKRR
jgi:hypothetical protein